MGKGDGDTQPPGWLDYFQQAAAAAGYVGRGWKARLARDMGVYDSHVSRWSTPVSDGGRVPDVDSCRLLARALGRPIYEVLIAAGRFTAEELGVPADIPAIPKRLPPNLERLRVLLDDNATPAAMKAHIEAQIAATADLVEGATESAERRIS